MAKFTLKKANERAHRCGLHVTYYNPGDNPTYKVSKAYTAEARRKDYFAVSDPVLRAKSMRTVKGYLDRYCGSGGLSGRRRARRRRSR